MAKNIVIIKTNRMFLTQVNNTSLKWGDEYPEAIIFYSVRELKTFWKDFKTTLNLAGAKAIQNYGTDKERAVA